MWHEDVYYWVPIWSCLGDIPLLVFFYSLMVDFPVWDYRAAWAIRFFSHCGHWSAGKWL